MHLINPPAKSNADETTTVIKTSGTKACATHSGVAKNIGTSSNIKIGKRRWNNMSKSSVISLFLRFIMFIYLGSRHNGKTAAANTTSMIRSIRMWLSKYALSVISLGDSPNSISMIHHPKLSTVSFVTK